MKKLPILVKNDFQFLDKNSIFRLINKYSNSKDDNQIRKKLLIKNKSNNIKHILNLRNNKSYNKALTKLITFRNNVRRQNLAHSTDNLFDSECFYQKDNFPNYISSHNKGESDSIHNLIIKEKPKKVTHRNCNNTLSYTNSFLSDNFNYTNLNKKEEKIIDLKKNKTFLVKNKNDAKGNDQTKGKLSVKTIILDEQSGKNNKSSKIYDKYMVNKLANGLNGLNKIRNLIGVNGFNGYKLDINGYKDINQFYYINKRNKKENSYCKHDSLNKGKDILLPKEEQEQKYFRNSVRNKFNNNNNKSLFNNSNKSNEYIAYIKSEVIKFYKNHNFPSKLDFYRDWTRENGNNITINDISFYLNNIIHIKIRKDEIKQIIFNRHKLKELNELNFENFKNIFFGKKDLSADNINDKIKSNKINLNNLIESIKEKFYSEINKNSNYIIKNFKQNYKNKYELYYDEFYDLINRNIMVETELYFNDIIKRIFHEHCDKDNRINIMKFLEKIKENDNINNNDKRNNIRDIMNTLKIDKVKCDIILKDNEEKKRLSEKKVEMKTIKNEINNYANYKKIDNTKNKINSEINKEKNNSIKDLKSNNNTMIYKVNENKTSREEIYNSALTFNWINPYNTKRKGEKNSDIINLL